MAEIRRIRNFVVVDVRTPEEKAADMARGTANLPKKMQRPPREIAPAVSLDSVPAQFRVRGTPVKATLQAQAPATPQKAPVKPEPIKKGLFKGKTKK